MFPSLRSALAREALSRIGDIPSSEAALLLREAVNSLQDVVAATGQDAEAVRDVAGEALQRCEAALRALSYGTTRGPGMEPQPQQPSGGMFFGGPDGGGLGKASSLFGGFLGQGFGGRR